MGEYVKLLSMESSMIALVDIQINRVAFDTYRLERPCTIGMNLPTMRNALSKAGSNDLVRMYTRKGDEHVYVELFSREIQHVSSEYKWIQMDIQDNNLDDASQLLYNRTPNLVMDSSRFKDLCTTLGPV